MSEVLYTVPESVRRVAVDYSRRTKVPKGIISKYESGEKDNEPLLQFMMRAYALGQESRSTNIIKEAELKDLKTNLKVKAEALTTAEGTIKTLNAEVSRLRMIINNVRHRALGGFFGRIQAIRDIVKEEE